MATQYSICMISPDQGLREAARGALSAARSTVFSTIDGPIDAASGLAAAETADLVIADIDATQREQLIALQKLMIRLGGRTPVVVLTEAFDDAVGRWFLQIRVSDFLRKPVRTDDLLRACVKALRDARPDAETRARVLSFLAASGGAGATTLAIEAANQIAQAGSPAGESVCLVDLDFFGSACAEALDIEPRLDLSELGEEGERLDAQMLEVMLSKHTGGLTLLAARGRPGELVNVKPALIGRLLDTAAARFDHLIIDLPRVWTQYTDDVLAGSDRVYIVTDMTVPGLRAARRLAERVRDRGVTDATPGVIVNRF